jgi:site-specific DNA recombinase
MRMVEESYFLDLAAEEGWPKDKLREKINSIREERRKITRQLDQTTNQLETGKAIFLTALDLLDDPHALYRRGNETVKSILNRAFFTRLYVDGSKITDQELNEPFNMLHEAYTISRRRQAEPRHQGPTYHRTNGALALTADLAATTTNPEAVAWSGLPQIARSASLLTETGATSRDDLTEALALVLADAGSSTAVLVGTTGFEPATP